MKKSTKAALVLLVGGIGCCVAAGVMGVGNIISASKDFNIAGVTIHSDIAKPQQSKDQMLPNDLQVQQLDLDIASGEVTIQQGENWNLTADKSVTWTMEGTTLNIEQDEDWVWDHVTKPAPIVLTVPKDSLFMMECELEAGSITMDGLTISNSLACDVDVGTVTMKNMTVRGIMELNCEAGSIDFSGDVQGTVNADCDIGKIKIDFAPNSTIGLVRGNVDLGTCELFVDGKSYFNKKGWMNSDLLQIPNVTGKDLLSIDCDTGTVIVSFHTEHTS